MIVVDANIIVYRTISGERTAPAAQLQKLEDKWVAPTLCRHEVSNVLSTYIKNAGMTLSEAGEVWDDCHSILYGNEYEVSVPSVLSIARAYGISAYDAQYVALSRYLGVPLVTEDRKLLSSFPKEAYSMQGYFQLKGGV